MTTYLLIVALLIIMRFWQTPGLLGMLGLLLAGAMIFQGLIVE